MSDVQKYEFRLISTPNIISSGQTIIATSYTPSDYILPLHLSLTSKNVGYYQYVSQELNDRLPLITGQTSGFTLFDSSYQLPDEPDLSFQQIKQSIITGYSSSDLIISIKGYDVNTPYKVGTKVVDGSTITITNVNPFYVEYQIDLINYITHFNPNNYSSSLKTSPGINERFIFDSIEKSDKYVLSINLSGNTTDTTFYVFKNNFPLYPLVINGGKQLASTKLDLVPNDFLEVVMSSNTLSSVIQYSLVPEEVDNEQRYTTMYFFGNKTLQANNSISTGFIYKSDVQPYDEKPIVYNNIRVVRNGLSVFDSLFKLGSVGNVNDFEEFFTV